MNRLWCVTGAGHLLLESFAHMHWSCSEHEVTVAFSSAGSAVARIYGLQEVIAQELKGVISERKQGYSSPLVGRLAKRENTSSSSLRPAPQTRWRRSCAGSRIR
ncbi:MAG: hypothetical protein ACP5E9_00075 [Candidatus Methanospirareceae archaeon]